MNMDTHVDGWFLIFQSPARRPLLFSVIVKSDLSSTRDTQKAGVRGPGGSSLQYSTGRARRGIRPVIRQPFRPSITLVSSRLTRSSLARVLLISDIDRYTVR